MGSVEEPVERTRAVATLTVRPLDAGRSSKVKRRPAARLAKMA